MKNPIQPIRKDENGVMRFKANRIVEHILSKCSDDLNAIARMDFSQDDREQFAQLIGYSLNGFAELSYVSEETYDAAHQLSIVDSRDSYEARNIYLRNKIKSLQEALRQPISDLFEIHPDDLRGIE